MPIYEFECSQCGHRYDRLQKLSDADPVDCPECGAPKVRRRVSAPSFRLAGGGWYETDFKKPGDQRHNLAGDAGAPAGETRKDEAKPATGKDANAAAPAAPAATAATAASTAKPAGSGEKAAASAGD